MKPVRNAECGTRSEDAETAAPEITFSAPIRLLTREELAEALRVSVRTVDEMVALEEIVPVRIRGAVRFYLPDVVRSLTAQAVTSKRGCAHRLAPESKRPEVGR